MKRLILAASLTAIAGSVFAVEIGKPFEQLDLDRALPTVEGADEKPAVSPFAHQHDFIAPAQ